MTRQLPRARRIIDGAGAVVDHGAVLIADTLIEAVGRRDEIGQPSDIQVVDPGDSTVLPRQIDVRNYVTFSSGARVVQKVMAHDTDAMLAH